MGYATAKLIAAVDRAVSMLVTEDPSRHWWVTMAQLDLFDISEMGRIVQLLCCCPDVFVIPFVASALVPRR